MEKNNTFTMECNKTRTKLSFEIEYNENFILSAPQEDSMDVLKWWKNNSLKIGHTHNEILPALMEGQTNVLDWWVSNSNSNSKHHEISIV